MTSKNVTESEKLATEARADEKAARLDLLRPVGTIRAYERLAIMAGAADLAKYFDGNTLDLDGLDPVALRKVSDFAQSISSEYAVDDAARDKLEFLPLMDYLETVLDFMALVGE